MSRSARKTFLEAEHAATASLLERLDEGQFVERIGLESRLEAIHDELLQLAGVTEPAQATLFFGGQPVIEQEAIDAPFAADAVTRFQALVEKVGVARGGAQSRDFRLHITGIARGSFGFEFTQMEEAPASQAQVKAAVEETSGVLEQLAAEEDAFAQFMSEADPRVLKSLHEFVKLLANSGATLRFVSGGRQVALSEQHVFRAFGWMEEMEPKVEETSVAGTLRGFMTNSRSFEYVDAAGNLYKGHLGGLVTDADLERFAFKPSVARIQTTTVTRPGRPLKKNHVLVSLHPPMDAAQP
jgi:hypothetical protein